MTVESRARNPSKTKEKLIKAMRQRDKGPTTDTRTVKKGERS